MSWNVIPKNSCVAIEDDYGIWIATTRSRLVAATIVETHNRNEEMEYKELTKLDDAWNKENQN